MNIIRNNGSNNLFFFKADDGIRDIGVTGVQTCALPISVFRQFVHASRRMYELTKNSIWSEKALGAAQDRKSVVKGKKVNVGSRRISTNNNVVRNFSAYKTDTGILNVNVMN